MATMSTTTFMNTNLVAWIIMMFIYASSISSRVESFFVRPLRTMVLANTKNIESIQGNITQSENRIIAAIKLVSMDVKHLSADLHNVNTTLGELSADLHNVNTTLGELSADLHNVNTTLGELGVKIENVNKTLIEKIENVDKKTADALNARFWVQCIVAVAANKF
jgi:septal ring factor EnvC (AmiA/AmiB activator)